MRKKIMVLCTGNSCRSQMSEGFLREFAGDRAEVHSAGMIQTHVNPRAIAVMLEEGIDISGHTSKVVDPELLRTMDLVITVCDQAAAACPATPPGVTHLHRPVKDPVNTVGTEQEIMAEFRRARAELRVIMQEIVDQYL